MFKKKDDKKFRADSTFRMQDTLVLSSERQKQLEDIVSKMKRKGKFDYEIDILREGFFERYGEKKKPEQIVIDEETREKRDITGSLLPGLELESVSITEPDIGKGLERTHLAEQEIAESGVFGDVGDPTVIPTQVGVIQDLTDIPPGSFKTVSPVDEKAQAVFDVGFKDIPTLEEVDPKYEAMKRTGKLYPYTDPDFEIMRSTGRIYPLKDYLASRGVPAAVLFSKPGEESEAMADTRTLEELLMDPEKIDPNDPIREIFNLDKRLTAHEVEQLDIKLGIKIHNLMEWVKWEEGIEAQRQQEINDNASLLEFTTKVAPFPLRQVAKLVEPFVEGYDLTDKLGFVGRMDNYAGRLIGGLTKSANEATARFFETLNNGLMIAWNEVLEPLSPALMPLHQPLAPFPKIERTAFKGLSEFVKKEKVDGLPDVPADLFAETARDIVGMNDLFLTMMVTPQFRVLYGANILKTGRMIVASPMAAAGKAAAEGMKTYSLHLPTTLGAMGFTNTYGELSENNPEQLNIIAESFKSAGVGATHGFIFNTMGYTSAQAGRWMKAKLPSKISAKAQQKGAMAAATFVNSTQFGAFNTAEELIATGEATFPRFAQGFAFGFGLAFHEIPPMLTSRALSNYYSTPEGISKALRDVNANVMTLRGSAEDFRGKAEGILGKRKMRELKKGEKKTLDQLEDVVEIIRGVEDNKGMENVVEAINSAIENMGKIDRKLNSPETVLLQRYKKLTKKVKKTSDPIKLKESLIRNLAEIHNTAVEGMYTGELSFEDMAEAEAYYSVARMIDNSADVIVVDRDVALNPKTYIAEINKITTIPPAVKDAMIKKVNETVAAHDPKRRKAQPILEKIDRLTEERFEVEQSEVSERIKGAKLKDLDRQIAELDKQVDDIFTTEKKGVKDAVPKEKPKAPEKGIKAEPKEEPKPKEEVKKEPELEKEVKEKPAPEKPVEKPKEEIPPEKKPTEKELEKPVEKKPVKEVKKELPVKAEDVKDKDVVAFVKEARKGIEEDLEFAKTNDNEPLERVSKDDLKLLETDVGKYIDKRIEEVEKTRLVDKDKELDRLKGLRGKLVAKPVKKEIVKEPIPKGWKAEVQSNWRRTKGWKAEVDWKDKRIVFETKEDLESVEINNHEIAHIIIENKLIKEIEFSVQKMKDVKSQLLLDFAEITDEMDIHPNFVREHLAMDYGNYLGDPAKVSVEKRKLFEKHNLSKEKKIAKKLTKKPVVPAEKVTRDEIVERELKKEVLREKERIDEDIFDYERNLLSKELLDIRALEKIDIKDITDPDSKHYNKEMAKAEERIEELNTLIPRLEKGSAADKHNAGIAEKERKGLTEKLESYQEKYTKGAELVYRKLWDEFKDRVKEEDKTITDKEIEVNAEAWKDYLFGDEQGISPATGEKNSWRGHDFKTIINKAAKEFAGMDLKETRTEIREEAIRMAESEIKGKEKPITPAQKEIPKFKASKDVPGAPKGAEAVPEGKDTGKKKPTPEEAGRGKRTKLLKAANEGTQATMAQTDIGKQGGKPEDFQIPLQEGEMKEIKESDLKNVISLRDGTKRLAANLGYVPGSSIRTGLISRWKRKAKGLFFPGTELIRLNSLDDFETFTHEVGHDMDMHLKISEKLKFTEINIQRATLIALGYKDKAQRDKRLESARKKYGDVVVDGVIHRKELRDELARFFAEKGVPKKTVEEGIAEFTKEWVKDPEGAQRKAPKYNRVWTDMLETNQSFKDAMYDIADWYKKYDAQSDIQKIESTIHRDPKSNQLINAIRRVGKGDIMFGFLDTNIAFRKLEEELKKAYPKLSHKDNPLYQVLSLIGIDGSVKQFLENHPFERSESGEDLIIRTDIDGALKTLKPLIGTWKFRLYEDYMVGLRNLELHRNNQPQRATESIPVSEGAVKRIEASEGKEKMEEFTKKLYDYKNAVLRYYAASGKLSKTGLKKILDKGHFHISYKRYFDEWEMSHGRRSFSTSGLYESSDTPLRSGRDGKKRKILSPFENILEDTYGLIRAANQNYALTSLVGSLQLMDKHYEGIGLKKEKGTTVVEIPVNKVAAVKDLNGNIVFHLKKAKPEGKPIISTWKDGKIRYWEIPRDYYDSFFKSNSLSSNYSAFWRALAAPSKWLKAGAVIYNPTFMFNNINRDQLAATFNSKYGYNPIDFIRGAADIYGTSLMYQKFLAAGGDQMFLISMDKMYTNNYMEREIDRSLTSRSKVYLKNPLRMLQDLTQVTEMATRVGAFRRTYGKTGSVWPAMQEARELTADYGQFGAVLKPILPFYPFFNANLQHSKQAYWTITKRPLETAKKAMTWVVPPTIAIWAWNNYPETILNSMGIESDMSNEEAQELYQSLPLWRRRGMLNVRILGSKSYMPLRKGIYGHMFGTSVEAFLDWSIKDEVEPSLVKGFLKQMVMEASPVTTRGSLIPYPLRPFAEVQWNTNFWTGAPVVPKRLQGKANELQYNDYTPEVMKQLGAKFNWSPLKIKKLTEGLTGGAVTGLIQVTDELGQLMGIVKKKPEDTWTKLAHLPVTKAFVSPTPLGTRSRQVQEAFDAFAEIEKINRTVDGYHKEFMYDETGKAEKKIEKYLSKNDRDRKYLWYIWRPVLDSDGTVVRNTKTGAVLTNKHMMDYFRGVVRWSRQYREDILVSDTTKKAKREAIYDNEKLITTMAVKFHKALEADESFNLQGEAVGILLLGKVDDWYWKEIVKPFEDAKARQRGIKGYEEEKRKMKERIEGDENKKKGKK